MAFIHTLQVQIPNLIFWFIICVVGFLDVGRVAICHSVRGHPARGVRHPAFGHPVRGVRHSARGHPARGMRHPAVRCGGVVAPSECVLV